MYKIYNFFISKIFGKNESAERLKTVEYITNHIDNIISKSVDERLKTVEYVTNHIDDIISKSVDERLKTVEWLSNQSRLESKFTNQLLQQFYNEIGVKLYKDLFYEYGNEIDFKTNYPIAYSTDTMEPESTYEGTSRPTNFVRHCIDLLGSNIKCLDIGAGPGGLVYEWIFNGIKAVGIDGSDFCKKYNIGFWNNIKNSLFTCDITQPFNFYEKKQHNHVKFNIITMWEVLEHIPEEGLESLFSNIKNHLHIDGYFIGSVSTLEYISSSGQPYHITVKSLEWWKSKMANHGIDIINDHFFNIKMFCRGVGDNIQDQHNYFKNSNEGFHFVAKLRN